MTECNRCGDCCESIWLNTTKTRMRQSMVAVDPDIDPDVWIAIGWTVESARRARENAKFLLQHWHRSSGGGKNIRWSCDAFNSETRLCEAHDERPAVCRDYPWYGGAPKEGVLNKLPKCSFWADLPIAQRPVGWQPITLGETR
jgi:Fe-S-cluster containining protein